MAHLTLSNKKMPTKGTTYGHAKRKSQLLTLPLLAYIEGDTKNTWKPHLFIIWLIKRLTKNTWKHHLFNTHNNNNNYYYYYYY